MSKFLFPKMRILLERRKPKDQSKKKLLGNIRPDWVLYPTKKNLLDCMLYLQALALTDNLVDTD